MSADWVPTAKLRWVERPGTTGNFTVGGPTGKDRVARRFVLQVWYSQDVPGYMRRDAEGEWRDVVVEEEPAP